MGRLAHGLGSLDATVAVMPDENSVRHTIEQYWKRFSTGDIDGLVALYTDDATVEDPVGTPVRHGVAEIRTFYESAQALADSIELRSLGVTEVCGDQAAFAMEIRPVIGGDTYLLHAIHVMTFADDPRLTSLRAFFQQEKKGPAGGAPPQFAPSPESASHSPRGG